MKITGTGFGTTCRVAAKMTLLPLLAAILHCGGGETLTLVGTVERKNIELTAPVSEVIRDIPVKIGDRIGKGDSVALLDAEVAEAELTAHQARFASTQATQTEAEREFTRMEGLRRANVSAVRELDRARRNRDEARAGTAEAGARLKQAQKRLNDHNVRSTSAGVVDQLPFDVGERVPAGGVVCIVLADESPWVRVWLPARVAARARPGLEARVQVDGIKRTLKGRIEDVAREPEYTPHYALTERERAHLVFETRVVLDGAPAELRPGIAADVVLTIPAETEGGS